MGPMKANPVFFPAVPAAHPAAGRSQAWLTLWFFGDALGAFPPVAPVLLRYSSGESPASPSICRVFLCTALEATEDTAGELVQKENACPVVRGFSAHSPHTHLPFLPLPLAAALQGSLSCGMSPQKLHVQILLWSTCQEPVLVSR